MKNSFAVEIMTASKTLARCCPCPTYNPSQTIPSRQTKLTWPHLTAPPNICPKLKSKLILLQVQIPHQQTKSLITLVVNNQLQETAATSTNQERISATMIATTTTRGLLLVPCIVSVLLLTASAFDSAPPTLLHAAGSGDLPAEPSAYEMLEGFGFPRGILPVGVTGYKYRPSDGAFQVFFDGDCEFEVDGYRIKYRQVISGNVEGGSIRNLGGVSVRMFLLNWGIDRVVMEGPGQLVFHVGPLSQVFSADNFEVSPECRCRGNVVMAAAMSDGVAAV